MSLSAAAMMVTAMRAPTVVLPSSALFLCEPLSLSPHRSSAHTAHHPCSLAHTPQAARHAHARGVAGVHDAARVEAGLPRVPHHERADAQLQEHRRRRQRAPRSILSFPCLFVWLFGCLVVWLFGCLVVCLVVWLFGWLFGCLVGCLVDRLVGRKISCHIMWYLWCTQAKVCRSCFAAHVHSHALALCTHARAHVFPRPAPCGTAHSPPARLTHAMRRKCSS